jgi:hypothetical protein
LTERHGSCALFQTARIAHRDDRRYSGPDRGVSGSDWLGLFAQNAANSRQFPARRAQRARSLHAPGLHGGGGSLVRTRLPGAIPVPQGK